MSGNRLADAFLRIANRYNRHPVKRRMPVLPAIDSCILSSVTLCDILIFTLQIACIQNEGRENIREQRRVVCGYEEIGQVGRSVVRHWKA